MPLLDTWLALSKSDRHNLLAVGAQSTGRSEFVLEKDLWVVATLNALFASDFAPSLSFKGGTSLSKCFNLIDRFSEDIDITWNLPEFQIQLNAASSGKKLKEFKEDFVPRLLGSAIQASAIPQLHGTLGDEVAIKQEGLNCHIYYPSESQPPSNLLPRVLIEFGGLGEPQPVRTSEVSAYLSSVPLAPNFPRATVKALAPERTFWEKVMAIHYFISRGNIKNEDGRHWYDIAQIFDRLDRKALVDQQIVTEVMKWKQRFFPASGVNYDQVTKGQLMLLPKNFELLNALDRSLEWTSAQGFFLQRLDVAEVQNRCAEIEAWVNTQPWPT